ncbi:MAG: M20 family metallo-hydrolase [Lachnospiraceae bacterium]|nr:M20 family metallo-hydrolase [Lachnospiraceae bacterium]
MRADAEELEKWLTEIDQFNVTPGAGTTRAVYTEEFFEARNYVKGVMQSLGLTVREDSVGNLFGEYQGTDADEEPIWTGSHIDTVPNGGRYDGLAGVFAGLEAVKMLKAEGIRPKRTISVNVYAGEEMSRFGICCIGSRALAGRITEEDLKESRDSSGKSIFQILEENGFDLGHFPEKGKVHASLELHIEQNTVLEENEIPVGVVTGICAPTNLTCTVRGVQSHAGGTSMKNRRDAFMAAAEISLALEELARTSTSEYITGTVGQMKLMPGAANVIPGQAEFSIDIRSISGEDKNRLVGDLKSRIDGIAQRRGVEAVLTLLNNDMPYVCDPHIRGILHSEAEKAGIPVMDLISGPYHDSLMLGDITDAGMIFIPCKNGISHDRAEAISMKDLARGTDVLAAALLVLANE